MIVTILKINFLSPYTANCLVFTVKRLLGCQYYCKILLPLINIAQCFSLDNLVLLCNILFCSWVKTRKYVEWYWCCLCGHCFSTAFNKRKESILDQRVARRPQHTHENLMTDLTLQWAENFFVQFDRPLFGGTLNSVIPKIAKKTLSNEKQLLSVSTNPLSYAIWPLETMWKAWN